jgi:hypothetical protein
MSTPQPPPQQPSQPSQPSSWTFRSDTHARLPVPGNAEFVVYLAVEILAAIVWAASDDVGGGEFLIFTAIVTFGYLISRGIAKASRVLEH